MDNGPGEADERHVLPWSLLCAARRDAATVLGRGPQYCIRFSHFNRKTCKMRAHVRILLLSDGISNTFGPRIVLCKRGGNRVQNQSLNLRTNVLERPNCQALCLKS